MRNNYPVYLPIRIKNAENDQDRIFPEVSNIDLESIQKQVKKPVIVFDTDQKILIQVSPEDILKVGLDTDGETIDALLHGLDISVPGPIQNGDMVITAFGKAQRQLNEAFTNVGNLFSTKTTSDLAEGSNQYFTQARARSASIQNSINPSETQRGASQRAIHLALESLRTTLEDLISLESTARISDVQDLSNQINNEIQNRTDADQILVNQIQDESQQRINSVNSLLNDISNLNSLINSLINDEISNRTNADDNLQSQIDTEVTNRTNADVNLQLQIDNLVSPVEIIIEENSFFQISSQNIWIIVPNLSATITIPGKYFIEFNYYGRSSSSNRSHDYRLIFDGSPYPATNKNIFFRDTDMLFTPIKWIIDIANPVSIEIGFRRSNGGGSSQFYEKQLHIRRIGDI